MYEDIPHHISPVNHQLQTGRRGVAENVFEMEAKIPDFLPEKGARNIEGYNRLQAEKSMMPYIVISSMNLRILCSLIAGVEDRSPGSPRCAG